MTVKITVAKFVSLEGGRGIIHTVFIEPFENMRELLGPLEEDPCDLHIITPMGDWEMKAVQLLNYDILDEDLTVATFRKIFF